MQTDTAEKTALAQAGSTQQICLVQHETLENKISNSYGVNLRPKVFAGNTDTQLDFHFSYASYPTSFNMYSISMLEKPLQSLSQLQQDHCFIYISVS